MLVTQAMFGLRRDARLGAGIPNVLSVKRQVLLVPLLHTTQSHVQVFASSAQRGDVHIHIDHVR